jgi:hypothetical protein
MKQCFLFLILILLSALVFAREVPNTNSGIANASPGDYIIRSDKQRITLKQVDIDYARKQMGLANSPNGPASVSNSSSPSNNRTNVSSSRYFPSSILSIIIGIIIIFIIRKIIKYMVRLLRERQRWEHEQQIARQQWAYEQQAEIQRQQYEFQIQQQRITEEKRIEGNLNWLKSVRAEKEIYNNTKLYISEREWQTFNDKFQFLKVTLLDKIILPDNKIMKPYLKCFIYGSSNNYTTIFHFKRTGLENKARIYYCQNRLDDQDLNQIKLFFESAKEKRSISLKLRDEILRRDKFKCVYCGRGPSDGVKLHVDHIIPFSKGGSSEADNLQTLCEECNLGKSNRHSQSNNENNDMPPPDMIAFYRNLLGLRLQFTYAELKTAFHESVAKYHPDTYNSSSSRDRENAETLMKQINEAYEILKKIAS